MWNVKINKKQKRTYLQASTAKKITITISYFDFSINELVNLYFQYKYSTGKNVYYVLVIFYRDLLLTC